MSNSFKATVRKLADLPWADLRDLFSWSGHEAIQATNPNLLVAKAANEKGHLIAFVTAEPVLLVSSFVLNPKSTPIEVVNAGNAIDRALAQQAGVSKFWIIIPPEAPVMEGEKCIRVMERKVYQPVVNTQPKRSRVLTSSLMN